MKLRLTVKNYDGHGNDYVTGFSLYEREEASEAHVRMATAMRDGLAREGFETVLVATDGSSKELWREHVTATGEILRLSGLAL